MELICDVLTTKYPHMMKNWIDYEIRDCEYLFPIYVEWMIEKLMESSRGMIASKIISYTLQDQFLTIELLSVFQLAFESLMKKESMIFCFCKGALFRDYHTECECSEEKKQLWFSSTNPFADNQLYNDNLLIILAVYQEKCSLNKSMYNNISKEHEEILNYLVSTKLNQRSNEEEMQQCINPSTSILVENTEIIDSDQQLDIYQNDQIILLSDDSQGFNQNSDQNKTLLISDPISETEDLIEQLNEIIHSINSDIISENDSFDQIQIQPIQIETDMIDQLHQPQSDLLKEENNRKNSAGWSNLIQQFQHYKNIINTFLLSVFSNPLLQLMDILKSSILKAQEAQKKLQTAMSSSGNEVIKPSRKVTSLEINKTIIDQKQFAASSWILPEFTAVDFTKEIKGGNYLLIYSSDYIVQNAIMMQMFADPAPWINLYSIDEKFRYSFKTLWHRSLINLFNTIDEKWQRQKLKKIEEGIVTAGNLSNAKTDSVKYSQLKQKLISGDTKNDAEYYILSTEQNQFNLISLIQACTPLCFYYETAMLLQLKFLKNSIPLALETAISLDLVTLFTTKGDFELDSNVLCLQLNAGQSVTMNVPDGSEKICTELSVATTAALKKTNNTDVLFTIKYCEELKNSRRWEAQCLSNLYHLGVANQLDIMKNYASTFSDCAATIYSRAFATTKNKTQQWYLPEKLLQTSQCTTTIVIHQRFWSVIPSVFEPFTALSAWIKIENNQLLQKIRTGLNMESSLFIKTPASDSNSTQIMEAKAIEWKNNLNLWKESFLSCLKYCKIYIQRIQKIEGDHGEFFSSLDLNTSYMDEQMNKLAPICASVSSKLTNSQATAFNNFSSSVSVLYKEIIDTLSSIRSIYLENTRLISKSKNDLLLLLPKFQMFQPIKPIFQLLQHNNLAFGIC